MGSAPTKEAYEKPLIKTASSQRLSVDASASGERRNTMVSSDDKAVMWSKFNTLWDKTESNSVTIQMTKHNGFSQNKINLPILKPITISWSEEASGEGLGLRQITFDGEKFVAVRNGWTSGPLRNAGSVTFKFASEGDIKLASVGIRSTPLSINVTKREDTIVSVTDDGFRPSNIYISEGAIVQFRWTGCQISHSVWPIAYCPEHGGFTSLDPNAGKGKYKISTKEGIFTQIFNTSGTYFFSTEARDFGTTHTCVVCVRPYEREHIIRIFDTHYDPALLEIEQGDRVWWQWDTKTCKHVHCIFEVEIGDSDSSATAADPQDGMLAEGEDEPSDSDINKEDEVTTEKLKFKTKSGGFRWYGPSRCGQMCNVFTEPGVYFFSDLKFEEMASYVGTIVVRPKFRTMNFVEIVNDKFKIDNLRLNQGDQLWFVWNAQNTKKETIALMEFERCLTSFGIPGNEGFSEALFWRGSNTAQEEYTCKIKCHRPTSSALKVCLAASAFAIDLPLAGVYHFKLPSSGSKALSVICNRSQQIHSIRVMKNTFKPKMLMIYKGDVVCWSWRDAGQHVIYQVSNTGERVSPNKRGFFSGPKRGLDSAFLYQFDKAGVYYYSSEAVPEENVGAIVVLDVPDVIEIPPPTQELMLSGLPIIARMNDVICWSFVNSVSDDLELCIYQNGAWKMPGGGGGTESSTKQHAEQHHQASNTVALIKRRCLNRPLISNGIFNFSSLNFQHQATKNPDEPGLVTIIVDPANPCPAIVYLSASYGFVPARLTLRTGESLIFDWRRQDSPSDAEPPTEAHNVFLVSSLNSATPMAAVANTSHFMHSGQVVADSTFLTTFGASGGYTFASQGAPGMSCVVEVSSRAQILHPPQFLTIDLEREHLDQGKSILIRTLDKDVDIYYSLDGSLPHPASLRTFKYQVERGVIMKEPGPLTIRAIAVSSDRVWSEVATSRLWIVLPDPTLGKMSPDIPELPEIDENKILIEKDARRWRAISLSLRGFPSTQPGCGEVLWTVSGIKSDMENSILEHFQIFVNNVTYSAPLSPNTRGVTVVGLVGGKTYTIFVEAQPIGGRFLPIKSNSIVLNLPALLSASGGPLMGVEFSVTPENAESSGTSIALTWPAIEASRPELRISAYQIFVDGRNAASMAVEQAPPTATTHHHFLLRDNLLPPKGDVKLVVVAKLPNRRVYSNERVITLPLPVEWIRPLPPKKAWFDYLSVAVDSAAVSLPLNAEPESIPATQIGYSEAGSGDEGESADSYLDEITHPPSVVVNAPPPAKTVSFDATDRRLSRQNSRPISARSTQPANVTVQMKDNDDDDRDDVSDRILPSNIPPYEAEVERYENSTAITVPDERRKSTSKTGSSKKQLSSGPKASAVVEMRTETKVETKKAKISSSAAKDDSQRKVAIVEGEYTTVESTTQVYRQGPTYYSYEETPPSQSRKSSIKAPQPTMLSPQRNRKGRSRSSAETTSGTTTSVTSSFSSPRDYPSMEFDNSVQMDSLQATSPNRQIGSPSSIATTVTERRYSNSLKETSQNGIPAQPSVPPASANTGRLRSIHESEVIDMGGAEFHDESTRQPVVIGSTSVLPRRVSDPGPMQQRKKSVQILSMPTVTQNELLEALVEDETAEDHDERATPFLEDVSNRETGNMSSIPLSDLPVPIVQVIDEATSKTGDQYNGGRILVRWYLDVDKLALMERRGLEISAFFLNVTGRHFADRISSHLSFDVAPDGKIESFAGETLLRHQWVLTGPTKNDDDSRISTFTHVIDGLIAGEEYSVDIICEFIPSPAYSGPNMRNREVTTQSGSVHFRCQGPPPPPRLSVREVGIGQVTIHWSLEQPDFATSYKLLVNGKLSKKQMGRNVTESTLDGLSPGSITRVCILAVNDYGASSPSRELRIICPDKPLSPEIEEQPNYAMAKSRGILIAWTGGVILPDSVSPRVNLAVSSYRVYVDGKLDGIVRKSEFAIRHGYQYLVTNVIPGRKYELTVRAVAGEEPIDSSVAENGPLTVSCPVISDASNLLMCSPASAPQSPRLRVENMTILGIDLAWDPPQQQSIVQVTGFQVLKNTRVYGTALPAESTSIRIREVTLGETVELQLVSLTDLPTAGSIGSARRSDSGVYSSHAIESQINVERPIGSKIIVQFTRLIMPPARVWMDKITGRSAVVAWTQSNVSKKQPTTHFTVSTSYQITWWSIGSTASSALNNAMTGLGISSAAIAVGDVCSQSLKAAVDASEQSFTLENLKTDMAYTVVVEGRLESSYVEVVEDEIPGLEERHSRTLVMSASADPIRFATGRPPDAPQNLAILSTTCHSILVGWDPCVEHGCEVIGLRVECSPIEREIISPHRIAMDILPNATEALIDGLAESTEYRISVIAITQEFFDSLPASSRWKSGKSEALPKNLSELSTESPWLPKSVIECSTSGTAPADEIRVVERGEEWCKVEWARPPRVLGTNRLVRIVVRWLRCERDGREDQQEAIYSDDEDDFAVENRKKGATSTQAARTSLWSSNVEVELGEKQALLQHLIPGTQYQVVIEAVVSVKVNISAKSNRGDAVDFSNRRTVHVPSRPIRFWTRCFLDPLPRLLCSSITTNSIVVSWERPYLTRIVGVSKGAAGMDGADRGSALSGTAAAAEQGRVVRLHLLGYTLLVNHEPRQQMPPEALQCTLTNCSAGTSYVIEVIAQTCIDPVFKLRMGSEPPNSSRGKRSPHQPKPPSNVEVVIPRDDIDEINLKPITVKSPTVIPGCILSASLHIQTNLLYDRVSANASISKIVVMWDANTVPANVVKQFSVSYQCERTRQQISKIFDSATRQFLISSVESGTVYTVAIDSTGGSYPAAVMTSKQRYNNNPATVCLQIATPGPPEPPRLIVTRRTPSVLSLAWTDPRLFSEDRRRLVGFKVLLDDAEYTELLPPSCHAFSLPLAVLSPARRACVTSILTSPDNTSRTWTLLSNAVGLLGTFAWHSAGDGVYMDDAMTEDSGRRPLPLPIEDGDDGNEVAGGTSGDRIDIRLIRVDDSQIVIGWNLNVVGPDAAEGIDVGAVNFQLTYTCSGQPTEKFVTIPAHHNSHTLSPVIPGATYKFHIMALSSSAGKTVSSKQMALASSRELTVETPAPPDSPKLRLRAVNFEYITIEWAKPKSYGNAQITAYKVYVNSVLEITLPTNQLTFTYSRGRGCSEYSFQVQAVSGSLYASPLSEPLTLTWPGVRPPELIRYQASDEATMIRVGWESPYATTGVTIRELFVHVVDRGSRKLVHKVGPIHPDCLEAEFINPFLSGLSSAVAEGRSGTVPSAGFNIFLEVCVAGVGGGQSFWSAPLPLVHSDLPPAPTIAARLLGLDDRMRVEQRAARLINRRDAISTKLAENTISAQQSVAPGISERNQRPHHKHRHGRTPRDYEQHLLGKLSDIDRKLLKVLTTLEQYSGEAVVSLTVHIPMTLPPDMTPQSSGNGIAGFRVFVDGKQLKNVSTSTTHPGQAVSPGRADQQQLHEVRIRLPVRRGGFQTLDRPHRINVACVSRSGSLGPLSSPVEVSTVPFRPFVHFCNFLAKPSACHPPHPQLPANAGPEELFAQCRFVDVFRRDSAVRRYFANRVLSASEVSLALDTSVFDLATRRTLFLRTLARGNRPLVVALFVEAAVCASSSRALSMFADFAAALEGMQTELTLIVIHHHHQTGSAPQVEPSPLGKVKSASSGHSRSRRHSKRAVQPLVETGDLEIVSKPSVGFSLLTSIECDVMTPLGDGRRTGDIVPKRLCELLRVSGVPSLLILNGETECGWVGRYCALTSTEFGAFVNHQINVISGIPCQSARGGNESGPGCIHCSRGEKRAPKSGESINDVGSLVGTSREAPQPTDRKLKIDLDAISLTNTSATLD